MTVHAIDPTQTRNAQRVADLATLGYLDGRVLDPTYGYGGMWTEHRPTELVAFDANPARGVLVADFCAMPFAAGAFDSVLFDPPYRLGGTPTTNIDGGMDDRFGIDRYRSRLDVEAMLRDGVRECARVSCGFVIVKCQAQVNGGKVRWQPRDVAEFGEALGLRHRDELHLIGGREQPAGRSQQHARRNFSTFVVMTWDGRASRRQSAPSLFDA